MDSTEQRVKKIVAQQFGVNEADINAQSSFVDDLGADSLDTVEMTMALEGEFEIKISELKSAEFFPRSALLLGFCLAFVSQIHPE